MPASAELLETFRRDQARGVNDDIDLTLRPAYLDLLEKLGNPQAKLPPVFHVAGTNGKGSVCAFLRAMLEAAGKRAHVYTSPHLVRFHERIRIAGDLIAEAELVEVLGLCRKFSAPDSITYFEAVTAAAFAAFARHPADYTIVEVGLGGRLDATNVIPTSLASLITRLSFDHRDYLGDTMVKIACEKAGIMREGVPCFAAAGSMQAMDALREAAREKQTPLFIADKDWHVAKTVNGFRYSDASHALDLPPPALIGEHQYDNAGLAIAALRSRLPGIRDQDIARGLQTVEWPARLQKLTNGALSGLLSEGSELWLDGGHNDSAGEALARQAEVWRNADARPLHLIVGMLNTKCPAEFLAPLSAFASELRAVAIAGEPASFTAEELAAKAREAGFENAQAANDIETALKNLATTAAQPSRILICGSLYLAGKVLGKQTNSDH